MKTKIIYISGNEIFDVADIRTAFEEVRNALNLDKTTVLFGVPVDTDDSGLMQSETVQNENIEPSNIVENDEVQEFVQQEAPEIIHTTLINEAVIEQPVDEMPDDENQDVVTENTENLTEEINDTDEAEEKVVPILSVLSTKEDSTKPEDESEPADVAVVTEEVEIISEISDDSVVTDESVEDFDETNEETSDEDEDLEKLLSAMAPLQEDIQNDKKHTKSVPEPEDEEDVSVDATLEQLATEFAETQDKIATGNKTSARSKIGKLRNILPFKQSKHKDQGLGDLFGWAGIAANDEDFSVPGFFTNAASKK